MSISMKQKIINFLLTNDLANRCYNVDGDLYLLSEDKQDELWKMFPEELPTDKKANPIDFNNFVDFIESYGYCIDANVITLNF